MKLYRKLFFACFLACLLQSLPAQTFNKYIRHGGITRNFLLHLPPGYSGNVAVPLIFNLHGYGSDATQQEVYSGMNAVADTAGFIVVYPNGVSNAWNSGFVPPYNGGIDDVGFVSALIDSIDEDYNIDRYRIYACGMSNGGFMSLRLACDLEDRIAAIASVTGTMTTLQFNNCNASREIPIFQIHGDNDTVVAYFGDGLSHPVDSVLQFWRNVNGCMAPPVYDTFPDLVPSDLSTVTSQYFGGCQAGVEVLHYKVLNGSHTWPGGLPIPQLGVTNLDIKASREIWHFFMRFTHPNPVLVGIDETEGNASSPQIFPNPFKEHFEIAAAQVERTVIVYSLDGRNMESRMVPPGEALQIPTGQWASGMYILQVRSATEIQSLKLIKE